MWTWLIALPLWSQIIISLIIVLGIILISMFGGLKFKNRIFNISLGRKKERSCGDCVLIMMSKREIYENKKRSISDKILKEQMNCAEQKLLEVQTDLLNKYREALRLHRSLNENVNIEELKQYRLYQGALYSGLQIAKDEIRRSFKENGFEHMSGVEFSNYVKSKTQILYSLTKNYIADQYPYEGMIVNWEAWSSEIQDKMMAKIEDMCFDLYQKAKDIKKNAKEQIKKTDEEFILDINGFVKEMSDKDD